MPSSRCAILLAAVVLLASWQVAALALDTMALPEPWRVFVLIGRMLVDGSLAGHLAISLARALGGILLALGAAVPLGLITGSERWWDRRLSPFIYLLYPIPHVVLLPLVILLFGIGNLSKIVLIGLIVFFQILVTTRDAARAIAALAKEPVPDYVCEAYGGQRFSFGPDYVIPKALDLRHMEYVAGAVAEAAITTGVARLPLADLAAYRKSLGARLEASRKRMELVVQAYNW